jgi:hypothetical protein
MDSSVGKQAKRVIGEKGNAMRSMYGLTDSDEPQKKCQATLIALFSGTVDDTSESSLVEMIKNVKNTLAQHKNSFDKNEFIHLNMDLITSCFQLRDIRTNGKGRRKLAYTMFLELYKYWPQTMIELFPELVNHGSWLDLNKLYELCHGNSQLNDICEKCLDLWTDQLRKDNKILSSGENLKEISLLAKWIPKEKASLNRKTRVTEKICERLFPTESTKNKKIVLKKFRKFLAPIQTHLRTTECYQCAKKYNKIDFNNVPGKCLFKNKKAFLYEKKKGKELRGKDPKRLQWRNNLMSFLSKAAKGKVTVKGKTMYIHDLVEHVNSKGNNLSEGDKQILNGQYQAHVKHYREIMAKKGLSLDSILVLADVSGSMSGKPMAASSALAILLSDLSKGAYHNKFLSFSTNPTWVDLSYPNTAEEFNNLISKSYCYRNSYSNPLGIWDSSRAGGELDFVEKVRVCYNSPWGGNTDFLKAHDLILDVAIKNKLISEDLPKYFLIASDMQFDLANRSAGQNKYSNLYKYAGSGATKNVSYGYGNYTSQSVSPWSDHYEVLVNSYRRYGYTIPEMIFWNMRATGTYVTSSDHDGVQMVGGLSTMQLKLFLENMNLNIPEAPKPKRKVPWDTFRKAMDDESYESIKEIILGVGEDVFGDYDCKSVAVSVDAENTESLQEAKKMLDMNLITKEDYEMIKHKVIGKLI